MKQDTRSKILDIVSSIIRWNIRVTYKLISKFKKNSKEYLLTDICKELEDAEFEVSYSLKPKNPEAVPNVYLTNGKASYAIVMQGPIRMEENFTANTVGYYKRLYGEVPVIVSTWADEKQDAIDAVRRAGAIVILCKKPISAGHLNVNYQLVNTLEGIKFAHDLGVRYVAKTRTDQKITKPYIFEYMINLLNVFAVNDRNNQEARIVTLSMNYGNMFYPYLVSDFLYFGTVHDMLNLFEIPLDSREKFSMKKESTRREYAQKCDAPEVYILVEYLKKLDYKCDFTVEAYWKALRDYFICVDRKTVGLVWPKYMNKYAENEFMGEYFTYDNKDKLKTLNFDFVNWLNLYSGTLEYKPEYERYADVIFK